MTYACGIMWFHMSYVELHTKLFCLSVIPSSLLPVLATAGFPGILKNGVAGFSTNFACNLLAKVKAGTTTTMHLRHRAVMGCSLPQGPISSDLNSFKEELENVWLSFVTFVLPL